MNFLYNLLLFTLTLAGGCIPIFVKRLDDTKMHYLLAFSGSFLLSITFLHLIPESFSQVNRNVGFFLLAGFFLQLAIQRLTHGVEHGHVHFDEHQHHVSLTPILLGLTVHAFMEGLPLGFQYLQPATGYSLYLAVAAHKLPEAMLATALVVHTKSKQKAFIFLVLFSLITPLASMLTAACGRSYDMTKVIPIILPLVAGVFIHISTTIFFESGTRHHSLSFSKILAIMAGLGASLLTLVFE